MKTNEFQYSFCDPVGEIYRTTDLTEADHATGTGGARTGGHLVPRPTVGGEAERRLESHMSHMGQVVPGTRVVTRGLGWVGTGEP